ncbi:hypothetical protein ACFVZR_32510 [Streptomyces sp. NPDC058316]|uniref:hypothetical protein n=1 Tax=unclassified Streptomyces TaxID=2593676 RepID=UPI00331D22A5
MTDEIKTTDDLKRLFGEYPQIADVIGQLSGDFEVINKLNLTAGGHDDEVAEQYNGVAKIGTQTLNDIVKLLKDVTASTGESGQDVMKLFQATEEDAKKIAADWGEMRGKEKE